MAKKVQLSKKINGVAHQIYPKTVYDVVVDKNGKTLLLDIEAINSDLERIEESIPTKLSDLQGVAEIVTESEINTKLDNYYTKEEVDSKLENIESGTVDLENYYTKDLVYTKTEVDNKFKDVSSTADLKNYYTKDEVYNKDEVIELIDQAQFPEGGEINLSNYYNRGEVDGLLLGKQNTLESGVNIKKINGKSILGSGNIDISGEGSSIEIITADDTTTSPTDSNVYSALKVNNEFTRNNEKETIGAQWLFLDLTVFEDHIQSPDYTGNVLGSGWYLGFDNGTNSHLEVDTLKVRKKAIFDTLEIKHVAHVGGEIMLTPAGATIELTRKLTSNDFEGAYKDHFICYIKTTDSEGNVIENQFAEDDLVMCKTFNVVKKVDENGNAIVNNTYYWRKCIKVGIEEETKKSYIILSDSDKDAISDEPKAGDVIVTVGNSDSLNKSDRQNAIVISAYSSDAPSICLYQGIGIPDDKNDNNIYSLRDDIMPVRISPKGNKFTGNFIIENKKDVAGSLVQVLESLISFSVTGLSYNELLGVDAVDSQVESDSNSVTYSLKAGVVKTWQQGDNVAIKLRFNEEALQNKTNITISLLDGLEGKFDVNNDGENEQTIEAEDLENPSIKLFLKNGNEFDSDTFRIKITGSENCLPYSVEARAGFNTELRRTGIDIENGIITLLADTTRIIDSEGEKSLARFTKDQIDLSVYDDAIDELTGKVDATSLTLEQGALTIDADKTTIKDTGLTLALFTKDQINFNVYEPYGEMFGEDAVVEYKKPTGGTRIGVTLNSDVTKNWNANDIISIKLKYNKLTTDGRKDVSISGELAFFPLEIRQKEIYSETIKTFTITSIPNIITINSDNLPDEVLIRRVLPNGLKRTGIDIESGQITLDADKTVIKDGNDSFDIALFTKNLITLLTESEGNAAPEINSYDLAEEGIQNSEQVYYREYTLNSEIVSKWKKDEIITMSFIINPISLLGEGKITVTGTGALYGMLTPVTKLYVKETGIIQCSAVCTKDAIHLAGNTNLKLKIYTNFPHYLGDLEVYSKLYGKIKKAGIDLNDGTITLNAETTKIKSGEQNIALFTIDNEGRAIISTDLIDAKNILAEVLKTRGSEDSNYISIKDNSLSMFDNNKYLKFLLHSGELIQQTNSINFDISIPNTIGQNKTLSDGLFITEPFYIPAKQNILQIPPFNLTINKNWPINTGHAVYIYLYAVLYVNDQYKRACPIGNCKTHEEYPTSSYTKLIVFPNITLSEGRYRLYMVAKSSTGFEVTTTGVDILGTAYLNVDRQEIASNGYNFNYSTDTVNIYQKGSSEGFEMICGLYGLKIDGNGIYVRGRGISDSVNWKQLDLSKLPFIN